MASLKKHRRSSPKQSGFTVMEMMIALTISLVALGIAAQLILEAQRRLAHSGRSNLDMSVDLAFDQLRLDVRGSSGFSLPLVIGVVFYDGATHPLELQGHFTGDAVIYELVDGDLRRVVYDLDDLTPKGTRIVLQNVSSFRWRPHPIRRSMLEMQVVHGETADLTRLVAAGQRESLTPKTSRVKLMALPRDPEIGNERTWW